MRLFSLVRPAVLCLLADSLPGATIDSGTVQVGPVGPVTTNSIWHWDVASGNGGFRVKFTGPFGGNCDCRTDIPTGFIIGSNGEVDTSGAVDTGSGFQLAMFSDLHGSFPSPGATHISVFVSKFIATPNQTIIVPFTASGLIVAFNYMSNPNPPPSVIAEVLLSAGVDGVGLAHITFGPEHPFGPSSQITNLTLEFTSSVPEPGTAGLALAALAVVAWKRKRRLPWRA